ncbi:hypothetical protein NPX13_g2803 [Xylaria arbuscula]|uniref:Heterokaryon incompatibility domain-containing protein n=1 Tax=Xylaria arbuscula TaxID=114810 RepID=A0A9W8NJQ2_9PEZI|nr:hypothetical protein NPX13_g2803 [Xylaria arbuscula]
MMAEDDLADSLSVIRERCKKLLVASLLDIQKTRMQHTKPISFMQGLECLEISTPREGISSRVRLMASGDTCLPTTFTRRRINALRSRNYVALSYTWDHPLSSEQPSGKYFVQSHNGCLVQSEVRDSVFERAGKYMMCHKLHHLWIDRECIVQEASEEKEIALQVMDLVYQCSDHPIALLYQPVLSTGDLMLLAGLMKGKFVYLSETVFKLSAALSYEVACRILKLLEAIVGDVWWSRAWTYQENYRGGTNMHLLIPHKMPPGSYPGEYVEIFGGVPGEVTLNSAIFHEAATAFCLAFDPPTELKKVKELVCERAGRYTLLLQKPGFHSLARASRSMSPLVISDIEKRHLKLPSDRLPIIANCCQYSVRLNGIEIAKQRHSVSLAILALFLLNGEILYNGPEDTPSVLSTSNIIDFLKTQAFRQYSPPLSALGLTYNKSCRFINVQLDGHGIKTQGHLWKLGCYVDTSEWLPFVEDKGSSLPFINRHRLMLLANELLERRHLSLYEDICDYLEDGDGSKDGISFARSYQHQMAGELAAAISAGKLLQLGVLWNPSNKYQPYSGIFICNGSSRDTAPKYVFTASQERQRLIALLLTGRYHIYALGAGFTDRGIMIAEAE